MEKRFEYRKFTDTIYDNLTGKHHRTKRDIVKLLNQVDDRANRNAELYWDLRMSNTKEGSR